MAVMGHFTLDPPHRTHEAVSLKQLGKEPLCDDGGGERGEAGDVNAPTPRLLRCTSLRPQSDDDR